MVNYPPELKLTAVGNDGHTYWLALQTQEESNAGVCQGCSFSIRTCEQDMPSEECSNYDRAVWKVKQQ